MTLTAFVGALLALLPRPERPVQIPVDSEVERLTKENARLRRSQARLVDHIERLEREVLTEQHLCTHWREAAQRIAKQSRENREAHELRLSQEAQELFRRQSQAQALASHNIAYNGLPPGVQALYQQQSLAMAQAQAQQAQLAQLAQAQNQQAVRWREGFCNCVPGRSQVWEANRGEG